MSPMSPMSGAMSSFTWRLLLLPADLLLAALSLPESSRASAVRYNVTIQPAAGTGNMKLQNVHCSCTVGNLWDSTGQKFWKNSSKLWGIDNVSFDSMIKDAWESTQSTSRSVFRMYKMAMNPFRRFNISMSMSLRDDTQCIVCFMFYTTFCCNCCIPWNVYKKIYVICIIRPPSGLRNSGHLILHLKKISLHIEWCSSCYLKWEWILLLSPLTHFYCIKFSSKSFKRI